jgi:hypothetical protein
MKKYSDVFIYRDNDNNYIICYTRTGAGHIDTKPYTFTTREAAESIADQMRKMEV